ncbi:non-ribosomal peptide synthetase [Streptomyces formicae]|uniref:non-ribosomal peptide synthetase n=1 Tax=Streptomyces formicae TaxID=1616117 RepID=UPI00361BD255
MDTHTTPTVTTVTPVIDALIDDAPGHALPPAGAVTTVPRWTREPVPGAAEHEVLVPDRTVTALRATARELAVPFESVLLAAHAKALAALTGDREIVTGYVTPGGGRTLPCRMDLAPGTWRTLLAEAHRSEAHLRDAPAEASFETVLDPTGGGSGVAGGAGVALWVGLVAVPGGGGGLVLRLRYRTDVLDGEGAARVAGYHVRALELIAADPDGDHLQQSLLSAQELRFQLEELAGRRRELPGRRVHELFEERVRVHPDAVAAVCGERVWSYGELNARANRLARALVARGVGHERVVAVVMERNPDWLASVLAVFKAGAVYLPVEPHFPADRIARTLSRAGCVLALSEKGSTGTLDQALTGLPQVDRLLVDETYGEEHAEGDLGVEVAPDQLAYIYFTSGSTGEPKGAMCEHAGLLNHLFAKIDDLGIGEDTAVAQVAPQCFDISLWQLVSALLTGGRTVLVEQDVILDVHRFLDTVTGARVGVVQVVPSYLDAVVTALERQPRELPDLRCVSVTGEALKRELAERWFAVAPGVRLVNAYGLTETSDDTNHEVMDRAPERVLLGRPIANVHVYVVDEQLNPVPLGAPGEIVFSGVCVGRGYINDEERTAAAFLPDPHRPGERLYRSGDHGRWWPDGKLEFLGRKDSQVKIRGFRIEIGEIENTLLRVDGIRDGAVVVTTGGGDSKQLIAFYTGPRPLDETVLRARLGGSLPAYMVPAAFHWQEQLPLTANGKTDKKALAAHAADPSTTSVGQDSQDVSPATPAERRLAAAWAGVLGIPEDQVHRDDHFFDRGGSSLSAVKLAIALDRAISLNDITHSPRLADLARLINS